MVREDCKYLEQKIVNGKETNTCRTDKNGVTVCFYCDNCTRYEKKGKENWQVLQEKINKMEKDEFIETMKYMDRDMIAQTIGIKESCATYSCSETCSKCVEELLEREYQPPKQEKWIVHRTLRTKGVETYVSYEWIRDLGYYILDIEGKTLYGYIELKDLAQRFSKEEAIRIRDSLNVYRKGKQYLWVTSRVEE